MIAVRSQFLIANFPFVSSRIIEASENASAQFRIHFRQHRAEIFRDNAETRKLNLSGWNGTCMYALLKNFPVLPVNIYVSDIDEQAINGVAIRYGFTPVVIAEAGQLPFTDKFFDIVFCSSVIEHVTVPKEDVWTLVSGQHFRDAAQRHQNKFANEIRRLGKGYFVQAPYRWFPIETHSLLPFVSYLPRRLQVPLIRFTNRFWIKKTSPHFYLPTVEDMKRYFPDASILREYALGMTKSLIAYRRN